MSDSAQSSRQAKLHDHHDQFEIIDETDERKESSSFHGINGGEDSIKNPGYGGGGGGYQGGYGAPSQPAVNPEIQQWFQSVDRDRSGQINWQELQSALINGQGENFSDQACKLMVGMFDTDRNGTIGLTEFQLLYNYINQWLAVFRNYDRDRSGSIEEGELGHAFQQMGFSFSPEFVRFLITKSDFKNHRCMSVDQFIVACVQIQRYTDAFRARDKEMKGVITLAFEDYLNIAISCLI
ncbi:hypothetical protein NQ315_002239 [Exocentrus adspersus]|uniref:EF-hand domain-containing protein n=1 Tax=Exocentrus adspersus TaxID=1586481 RepID=A0AAV8W064_9CUCU|nr:hypothetical protein NQ315_002239 [Exocentrus adspersus]